MGSRQRPTACNWCHQACSCRPALHNAYCTLLAMTACFVVSCGNQPGNTASDSRAACRRYGMREALAILAEEGLQECWQRHEGLHHMMWEGLNRLGLKSFIENDSERLVSVNTIAVRQMPGSSGGGCGAADSLPCMFGLLAPCSCAAMRSSCSLPSALPDIMWLGACIPLALGSISEEQGCSLQPATMRWATCKDAGGCRSLMALTGRL